MKLNDSSPNKQENFFDKHMIIGSVLLIVIALAIQFYTGQWMKKIGMQGHVIDLMMQITPVIFLVFAWKSWMKDIRINLGRKGALKGLLLGWIMLGLSLLNINRFTIQIYGIHIPPISEILIFVGWMLMVGVFEELMMRGLILNKFLQKWGHTQKGIYRSVWLSSLLFGIAHLVNLLDTPQLVVATLALVIYATFIGVFLASIYLRGGNLWASIICHATVDFTAYFTEIFSKAIEVKQKTDITPIMGLVNILFDTIFLVAGLWYLRKVKKLD